MGWRGKLSSFWDETHVLSDHYFRTFWATGSPRLTVLILCELIMIHQLAGMILRQTVYCKSNMATWVGWAGGCCWPTFQLLFLSSKMTNSRIPDVWCGGRGGGGVGQFPIFVPLREGTFGSSKKFKPGANEANALVLETESIFSSKLLRFNHVTTFCMLNAFYILTYRGTHLCQEPNIVVTVTLLWKDQRSSTIRTLSCSMLGKYHFEHLCYLYQISYLRDMLNISTINIDHTWVFLIRSENHPTRPSRQVILIPISSSWIHFGRSDGKHNWVFHVRRFCQIIWQI